MDVSPAQQSHIKSFYCFNNTFKFYVAFSLFYYFVELISNLFCSDLQITAYRGFAELEQELFMISQLIPHASQ
jgi:hypothetical protein